MIEISILTVFVNVDRARPSNILEQVVALFSRFQQMDIEEVEAWYQAVSLLELSLEGNNQRPKVEKVRKALVARMKLLVTLCGEDFCYKKRLAHRFSNATGLAEDCFL